MWSFWSTKPVLVDFCVLVVWCAFSHSPIRPRRLGLFLHHIVDAHRRLCNHRQLRIAALRRRAQHRDAHLQCRGQRSPSMRPVSSRASGERSGQPISTTTTRSSATPPSTSPTIADGGAGGVALCDALRAVEAAERAVVEPGVEPIANISRIVPAVVGEACARNGTSNQSLPFAAQLGVNVGTLAVQHSEPVVQQNGRWRPRRNASASTALTAHNRIIESTSSFSNTHRIDTRQQWRPTARRAHIGCQLVTVSCRGSV